MLSINKVIPLTFFVLSISWFGFAQNQSGEKRIHVKFKEQFRPSISSSEKKTARSGRSKMDQVSEKYNAISLQRIFPEAGKYESAHRAYGLHLWYELKFSKETKLQTVITEYKNLEYFQDVVESIDYISVSDNIPLTWSSLPSGTNDPYFDYQWHFQNTGQTGGKPGSDINLKKAWQIETGSPKIIIAVIDGGINVSHPDLANALWTNTDEIAANGIDDDNNGYVDDVHGYGFGDQIPQLFPDGHATHVAGIIGAVNNNGIGVSGIAGGSGLGDGVRLMSCAGFGSYQVGGFEAAMVYAADNGAVISQNSWGGGSSAIVDAINYFINRAGYDNSEQNFAKNIQTGPMAGGLVIFAAGNANTFYPSWPANYQNVIAVASTNHMDGKSYFSNYGTWVDISAPGSEVLSTYESGYALLSGTSMACPHVSGVAALIISHFQRQGLKPNEVWNRLRLSAQSIALENSTLIGLLPGRVDALASLREPDAIPPAGIVDLHSSEIKSSSARIEWTATGEDGSIGQAAEYEVRYSTSPITVPNFNSATKINIPPLPPIAGESVSLKIENLTPQTTYYVALKSRDLFNNLSPLSNIISFTTLKLPGLQLITNQLQEQLFTGGVSTREILCKNTGDEDELQVRISVPNISDAPVGLSGGSSGKLFAVNTDKNTIDALDTKTGLVIHSIPLPQPSSKAIEGLAFDGNYLFYSRSGKIYKINASTGEVLRSFDLPNIRTMRGLAWSGKYLYASCELLSGFYGILEVDSDNGSILRSFSGYSELTFGGNRGTLFKTNEGKLSEIDISSGQTIREVQIGGNPNGLAYSAVDDVVFVSDIVSPVIRAINPDDGTVLFSFPNSTASALAGDEFKRGWLTNKEQVVTIPPNGTVGIPVNFDATDLPAGTWSGKVQIFPLNITESPKETSLSLQVTAASDLDVVSRIDFGTEYIGNTIDSTILIENRGFSDLIITNIQSNDDRVKASLSSTALVAGQKVPITVTITPGVASSINAVLTFLSNDPDEGILTVPVTAEVLLPPAIILSPDSLKATLITGDSTNLNFNVTNTGGSTLNWRLEFDGSDIPFINQSMIGPSEDGTPQKSSIGEFALKASSPEGLSSLTYDPTSGFLYAKASYTNTYYKYNPEINIWASLGSTPTGLNGSSVYSEGNIYHGGAQLNVYSIQSNSWSSVPLPIEGIVTRITSDGQSIYAVINSLFYRYNPLTSSWLALAGLPFNLIGSVGSLSYTSGIIFANQNSNGFTGDGNTPMYKYLISTNTWFPSKSIIGKACCGSTINPSTREYFVLGAPYGQPGNNIQMSVLTIEGTWKKLALPFSISTDNAIAFVGKTGYSGIYFIEGGSEKKFGYYETVAANWITITPTKGKLATSEEQTITVKLNARGISKGVYLGNVKVSSTRPALEKSIPLRMTVESAPDILLSQSTINAGEVVIGIGAGSFITIKNTGADNLFISSITTNNPEFGFSGVTFPIVVPWGESTSLLLSFNPTESGQKSGVFSFHSNDPDESDIQFVFQGKAVTPAIPTINPGSLSLNLLSGNKIVKNLLVQNDGEATIYVWTFQSLSDWIRTNPTEYKTLSSGKAQSVDIIIDASGKSPGTYQSKVLLWNSREVLKEVPVTMNVTAATNMLPNMDSLNFGTRLVNNTYDSIIQITNNGVLPLSIASITSDNPTFKLTQSAPYNLSPGDAVTIKVQFNPTLSGLQKGHVTIISNDPEQSTYVILVKGSGVEPPELITSASQYTTTIFRNEAETRILTISNTGGSTLKWRLQEKINTVSSSSLREEEPMAPGDFTYKTKSPKQLSALTVHPITGRIYGQYLETNNVFIFNPINNTWIEEGTSGYHGSVNKKGGAVILNSKMYCVYPEDSLEIYVYDLILKDWSRSENKLGAGTATITTDGTLIYLAGGGNFKNYNPATGVWSDLPLPTISLDGAGGLSYYNGEIYAHEPNGGFARYTISTRVWENLVRVPARTVLGGTFDQVRKRYYAYGNEGNSYLYEYDIEAKAWSTKNLTLFEIGDAGGIVHVNTIGFEGIYFAQGNKGTQFGRYESKAELPWLRITPPYGELSASENQSLGVNFNAYKLSPGSYHGLLEILSNDPDRQSMDVPVKLQVLDPSPLIEVPVEISATVDRTNPSKVKLKLMNNGLRDTLRWNINYTLPTWLSASKQEGLVPSSKSDSIEVTFHPGQFTSTGVFDHLLEISSNDLSNPVAKTRFTFTLLNQTPILLSVILQQNLTADVIEISLADKFTDLDNDALSYSGSSANPTVASVSISGTKLIINPIKTGSSKITVTATDIFNSSVTTTFDAVVEIVTGVVPSKSEIKLIAGPNPFRQKVIVSYITEEPSESRIWLIDAMGRKVLTRNVSESKGRNEIEIDGKDLSSGLYYIILMREDKNVGSLRVIKN